ncbi:MAG TPA: suppressor of fused domain protein [Gemmatimonadaceae bacterium]
MSEHDDVAPESIVYRHGEPLGDPRLSFGDPTLVGDITAHLSAHLGPVHMVYHELISEYAHIDVYHFPPTPERRFHVLATSGMSERPMRVPDELTPDWRFAELLINLPSEWQVSEQAFRDDRFYWPIRLLKTLARCPHVFSTWLGYAHTIPNGEPPEPYAPNTALCAAMIAPPLSLGEPIHKLERGNGQVIRFWNVLPLYRDEMDFKLRKGVDALLDRFDDARVSDIVDPARPSALVRKRWWPF